MEVDGGVVLEEGVEETSADTCHIDLIAAVHANNTDQAKCVLGRGCQQVTLDSSLCWASRYGNADMVTVLLQSGANPNTEVWGGFTPVIWAAIYSPCVETLLNLIAAGADVNHPSAKRRQTALHAAVIRDNALFVSALLEGGADPDVRDYIHKTPLLYAVQRGSIACVKLLVHYNCDANLTGWVEGVSMSPLLQALTEGHLPLTYILILAGANFVRPSFSQTYTVSEFYATLERDLHLEVRPVYLQQHCRVRIRRLLKPCFIEKLRQINLPPVLYRYLLLEELDI